MQNYKDNIPERVSSLEATMNSLAQDLRETVATVKDIGNLMNAGFANIKDMINNNSKTDYSKLGFLLAGALAVGGLWFASEIGPIKAEIKADSEKTSILFSYQQKEIDRLAKQIEQMRDK